MINPEQVLDEVWTQLALRLESYGVTVSDQVAKLIAAEAINAWPGMDTIMLPRMMQPGHFVPQDYIRLPLTEKQDDKA